MMKAYAFCGSAVAALFAGASVYAAAPSMQVPTGARIEQSGFATIDVAPVTPAEKRKPDNRPQGEAGFYALDNGISQNEAMKRIDEQRQVFPEFEKLLGTLRAKEKGNFTSARMIHKPDWAYEFYFKRDAAKALAKYTKNPRFKPATAKHSLAELEAIAKPWTDRFQPHRLADGWGMDDTWGTVDIMMDVTEEEYRSIAAREGWGPVPAPIKLSFARSLPTPTVDARVRTIVRIFAQNDRSTGMQLEAAQSGKIFMKDGCAYVSFVNNPTPSLAYFHRETGVGLDDQGYLALIDRATGKAKGRFGETFTWAGPNSVKEDWPMVKELRAQCGDAPLFNVGNPESRNVFKTRYGH
jgi:hypothetical protein